MAPKLPLTLEDANRILEQQGDSSEISPDVMEFIDSVERAGKLILRQKEHPGEYVETASGFLMAAVLAELLGSKDMDIDDMKAIQFISGNMDVAKLIIGYAFMYSLGLASVEELR
jgi:hypothetical protein